MPLRGTCCWCFELGVTKIGLVCKLPCSQQWQWNGASHGNFTVVLVSCGIVFCSFTYYSYKQLQQVETHALSLTLMPQDSASSEWKKQDFIFDFRFPQQKKKSRSTDRSRKKAVGLGITFGRLSRFKSILQSHYRDVTWQARFSFFSDGFSRKKKSRSNRSIEEKSVNSVGVIGLW